MTTEMTIFNRAMSEPSTLQNIMTFAKTISQSDLVPDSFKNKPANCLMALNYAAMMGVNYLTVMQSMYVVYGKYSFSSSFLIGMANESKYFDGPIQFESNGVGKDLAVTAKAKVKGVEVSSTVSLEMAEAEGWTKKQGNKYKSMPEHMLRYRAATFLIRTHAPQILMGLHTKEEIEDMPPEKLSIKEESEALKQIREMKEGDVIEAEVNPEPNKEKEQIYFGTEEEQRGFNMAMLKAGVPADRLQEAHEVMIGQPKSYYKELIKEYTANESQ